MTLGISFIVRLIAAVIVIGVVIPQGAIFLIERARTKKDPKRVKLHTREKDE